MERPVLELERLEGHITVDTDACDKKNGCVCTQYTVARETRQKNKADCIMFKDVEPARTHLLHYPQGVSLRCLDRSVFTSIYVRSFL